MDNKNTFCSECGQENEPEFEYCKNCGAPLRREAPLYSELANNNANNQYQTPNPAPATDGNGAYNSPENTTYGAYFDNIDGIQTDEVALFIGVKAPGFIKKFSSMQIANTKASWCWPVAILSFLLGPLGAALWFFYRKMYKHAFILVAIGFAAKLCAALIRGESILADGFGGVANDAQLLAITTLNMRTSLSDLFINIVRFVSTIVLGIFSMNMYKNFVVSKIKKYRAQNSYSNYYRMGLSLIGGTSGGMVWVGIIVVVLINSIVEFAALYF